MARVVVLALLLGCAPRAAVIEKPARERSPGWCVEGELLAGEVVELCTEDLGTCRAFRELGGEAVRRGYAAAVGTCRPEGE